MRRGIINRIDEHDGKVITREKGPLYYTNVEETNAVKGLTQVKLYNVK